MVLWAPLGHLNLSQSLSSELLGTPITTIFQNIKLFLDRSCLHTRLPNLVVSSSSKGLSFPSLSDVRHPASHEKTLPGAGDP